MKIINQSRGTVLADDVVIADTPVRRITGLLNKTSLPQGQALVIKSCNSIHTFFMRFAIDVIFADKKGKIVGLKKNIGPFKISPIYWKANFVVELPAGTLDQTNTALGDNLALAP